MILSIPVEYYEVKPSEELNNYFNAHFNELEVCINDYMVKLTNVLGPNPEKSIKNSSDLSDSTKKIVCCAVHTFESCIDQKLSPEHKCRALFDEHMKKAETENTFMGSTVAKTCEKFPQISNACE